ncbi:BTAD domain-containing putative transcriptional regulator [Streptomyces sp. NPDC058052]|uniref:AfsR/SARP family transcriptional regulator n=1 Tax=Streptomyces sp. NPDC058052 TaxID=3346316 RepID=UPI0036E8A070
MGAQQSRQLRLMLLGPVQLWHEDDRLSLGPVRRQAVLVALALRPGVLVSQQRLLDAVWGDDPPGTGRSVLPSYVYALRRELDVPGGGPERSLIRGERGGYRLVADGFRLDLTDLAEHTDAARRARTAGDPAGAADRLAQALALFDGEPLAGLPGPFAGQERERLLNRRREAHVQRLECLVDLGRHGEALDDLTELCASGPYDEPLAALRMRALYGSGRQGEALTVFADLSRLLRTELGTSPGDAIGRVHEAILRGDPAVRPGGPATHDLAVRPGGPATVPGTPAPARRVVNELPGDAGRLIGRETELARLTGAATPGAVTVRTVDGPAGVGKSALVVRAARELSGEYPDGCLFVDLRSHSTQQRQTPVRTLQRLLRSLSTERGELPDELDDLVSVWRTATSGLRLLLVVDDALDADQVRPLLPAGAGSRVLVAGRRRLAGLDADLRVTLEPLRADESESLLADIIGAGRSNQEPDAIRRLARLCDGLPLALRLAGSRLQNRATWTVAHLVGRMAGDDRLGELNAGDRSVEKAFQMSYEHLPPEQRRAFRTLGVTPTVEFDVLTPAAMLGLPGAETEVLLEELVDTSLVQQPRPGRYRLHDLVRSHARRLAHATPGETAGAREAALRLHLDAARMASDWGVAGFPTGPRPQNGPFATWQEAQTWLDTAGSELADVVGHAASVGDADHACWLAEALTDYFVRQGRYHEAETTLETALAHVDGTTDRRMPPALWNCLGYTAIHQRRYKRARACLEQTLTLLANRPDAHEESRTRTALGAMALSLGDAGSAIRHTSEGLALARGNGSDWVVATALIVQGLAYYFDHQNEKALACFADALPHAEAIGRPRMRGRVLSCAADAHLRLGRFEQAKRHLRAAVVLVDQAGDYFLCARSLTRLGTAEQAEGDPEAAIALHHQALLQHHSLSRLTEPSYDWLEMDIRSRLGRAYLATGRWPQADREFQTVQDTHTRSKANR